MATPQPPKPPRTTSIRRKVRDSTTTWWRFSGRSFVVMAGILATFLLSSSLRRRGGYVSKVSSKGVSSSLKKQTATNKAKKKQEASKSEESSSQDVEIRYFMVEKSTQPSHIRYAARFRFPSENTSDNNHQNSTGEEEDTWKPISILNWTRHLSATNAHAMALRMQLVDILRTVPYKAYLFETKGVSYKTAPLKPFEFVVLDSPYLYQFATEHPDTTTFRKFMPQISSGSTSRDQKQQQPVGATFENLGGDATLVAPYRRSKIDATSGSEDSENETDDDHEERIISDITYSHLAAFVRDAPVDQVEKFWQMVMQEYLKFLVVPAGEDDDRSNNERNTETVWLNTEGTGIAWLHVRFDSRPKYYQFDEFAKET